MAHRQITVVVAVLMLLATTAESFSIRKLGRDIYNSGRTAISYVKDIRDAVGNKIVQTADGMRQSIKNFVRSRIDFCNRPTPKALSEIQPMFQLFSGNRVPGFATITGENEFPDFVKTMETEGWLKQTRSVIFLVHGFLGYNPLADWLTNVVDALLKNEEDVLVVLVDWSKGANYFYNYGQSASNTQTMGKALAKFALDILHSSTFQGNTSLLYLHCIGHSLGAHVCGQAGRHSKILDRVTDQPTFIFDRVTGLDPAGPGFENCTDGININSDSATCVDNIHTDGSRDGHWNPLIPHYGTLKAWGHVNFYPNGGSNQVGCADNDLLACSHGRVNLLFADSIEQGPNACFAHEPCKIETKCTKTSQPSQPFGYYSSCHKSRKRVQKGIYHLRTGDQAPYCF